MNPNYLVPNLRILRTQRFLSQQELANRANIERETITRLEMGQTCARGSTIRALAQALGVDGSAITGAELIND